jgi:hypothetical protein
MTEARKKDGLSFFSRFSFFFFYVLEGNKFLGGNCTTVANFHFLNLMEGSKNLRNPGPQTAYQRDSLINLVEKTSFSMAFVEK